MDSDFEDAVANMPQSRNRLENGRSENDKMSGRMWEAVEISLEKIRMEKAKGGRSKRRSRKETKGERQEKETEKGENNRNKESGRRMGDLG